MLNFLSVNNFTLVEAQQLELQQRMTVITGETGAGKSVMLQALGLALGDRADAKQVRGGKERAEIQAEFDIANLPLALQWLEERELNNDEQLCLLRRTVSSEGRSRAWVNGQTITLAELKELSQHLISIHSQHAHQALLQRSFHGDLVDAFVDEKLRRSVYVLANEWQQKKQRYLLLTNDNKEQQAKADFLQFQLGELEEANLQEGEFKQLEQEQKTLANAESILLDLQKVLEINNADEGILSQLHKTSYMLEKIAANNDAIKNASELFSSALIQAEEASNDIEHFLNDFSQDPERLSFLDDRLGQLYELSRKHRCKADELPQLQRDLQQELDSISADDETLHQLQQELEQIEKQWQQAAKKLSKLREKAAAELSQRVNSKLKELMMEHCVFSVSFQTREKSEPHINGAEITEFLVSTNPGQKPGSLNKIASGGELSRISLAIQVVTAEQAKTPTLVFDEVDVGIGGAVAEVVGKLLQELAENAQVLCVTHLPQVAAFGQQHIRVQKTPNEDSITSALEVLDKKERTEELARMLGGKNITAKTRAHAKEMLANAS